MTGPEHYAEAERLLLGKPVSAEERADGIDGTQWPPSEMGLREAQVHATLALAAATALNDAEIGNSSANLADWDAVCGGSR